MFKKFFQLFSRRNDVGQDGSNFNVRKKWEKLLDSDFDANLAHEFAANTLAQDINDNDFAMLLMAGNRDVASYFFEMDPERHDILSDRKVLSLLTIQNLKFVDDSDITSGCSVIRDAEVRALRILTGYAGLVSEAIPHLLFSHKTALVALALWEEHLIKNEVILQALATAGNYDIREVKLYCSNPLTYSPEGRYSLGATELYLIKTIKQYPDRVFDILYSPEERAIA